MAAIAPDVEELNNLHPETLRPINNSFWNIMWDVVQTHPLLTLVFIGSIIYCFIGDYTKDI